MPVTTPPDIALKQFLGATTRHTRRIEIYESDGSTRWDKDDGRRLKGGAVTVDYGRDERRSVELTLNNDDGLLVTAAGDFWYDKIIKVYRGVRVEEGVRQPRVLVLADGATGTDMEAATAFRDALISFGYGEVRINLRASTVLDLYGYDIIVALNTKDSAKINLLKQAYDAGQSVVMIGEGSKANYSAFWPSGTDQTESVKTTTVIQPQFTAHPVAAGWSAFDYSFLSWPVTELGTGYRVNRLFNPGFSTGTGNWLVAPGGGAATHARIATGGVDGGAFGRATWTEASTSKSGAYYTPASSSVGNLPANRARVVAGERLRAHAWARVSRAAQRLQMRVYFFNDNNEAIGNETTFSSLFEPDVWTPFEDLEFTVPAGATNAQFWIGVYSATSTDGSRTWNVGDTLDVDHCMLESAGADSTAWFDQYTSPGHTYSLNNEHVYDGRNLVRKNLVRDPRCTDVTKWRATGDMAVATVDGAPAISVIENTAGGSLYIDPNDNFLGIAGDTFHMSAEVKVITPMNMRARFGTYNGGAGANTAPTIPQKPEDGWVRYDASITLTAGTEAEGSYVRGLIWPNEVDLPAGSGFYVRNYLVEKNTDGDYFDGTSTGAVWDGTANASTSTKDLTIRYTTSLPTQTSLNSRANYTNIATLYGGAAAISVLDDDGPSRLVQYHLPAPRRLFEEDQFRMFLLSAINWVNPVIPLKEWEVQIGEFMIDRISEPNFPHEVRVTGRDYTKKCMLSKFAKATQFNAGTTLESIIAAIAGAAGITKRVLPTTGITVGRTFFFERNTSRWDAMKEICTAYNYEIFFDSTGFLVIRPFNDPASTPPTIYIHTGEEGQVGSYEKSTTDTRIFNHVIVAGESSDSKVTPVYAERINNDPKSPTAVSKIGDRYTEYISSLITTQAQANTIADSFLAINSLEEFELSFESLVLPWLEAGDIMGWIDPNPQKGDPDTFLLSSISIPLTLSPMSATGRRVLTVG